MNLREEHLIIWPAKCAVSSDALCHIISESFLHVEVNGDPSWPGENQLTDGSSTLGFWENNLPGPWSRTRLCTLFSIHLSCLVSSQQNEHGKQPHTTKGKATTSPLRRWSLLLVGCLWRHLMGLWRPSHQPRIPFIPDVKRRWRLKSV